jgi:hypothetical protein
LYDPVLAGKQKTGMAMPVRAMLVITMLAEKAKVLAKAMPDMAMSV